LNKFVACCLFIVLAIPTLAQNRFGFEFGEGWAHLKNGKYTPGHYKFATDPEITFGVSYLRRMNKNIYIGGKILIQQYAFTYNYDSIGTKSSQNGGEITNKSTYVFIAPTFNFGFGDRQIIHIYVSGAYGSLLHGTQNNHVYNYTNGGSYTDYGYRSDANISKTIMRLDIGLCEHIPISPDLYLTLSESYGILQQSLTELNYLPNELYPISPGYINLSFGLSYKYIHTGWHQRFVDEDD